MKMQAGTFIKSTEALDDTIFSGVTIFITELNSKGAVGFVIDRPFGRSLNELQEFRHSLPFPLFEGGPVDKEHLFFLHRRPDLIKEGIDLGNGIFLGGSFRQAVAGINNQSLLSGDIKIFVGYCGWDVGELETEIEEGSWVITQGEVGAIFS